MSNDKKTTLVVSVEVPNALEALAKELQNLQAVSETPYKTGGFVIGFGKNIKDETDISVLIQMHSSVVGKKEAYDKSQAILNVPTAPVFKNNGFTAEEVEHDIKLRINVLSHAQRKAELEKLIEEGKSFLTREDQYSIYLKKLEGVLTR